MIKDQWYAIVSSKEVPMNKLIAVKRLGIDLCLFRNSKGEIGCVVDKCSHRGAALSKGKQKEDCVACPFHGLEFDKDGKCTLIPANGKLAEVESRYNVMSYLVKEDHNMIYIWYGDKEKATDKLPFFDEFIDDSHSYSEMTDCWNTHYSRCIENQLDVVHIPFVHYNTIGRGNKTVVNGPPLEVVGDTIIVTARNSVDDGQKPLSASECTLNPNMNIRFKFPNVWQNLISEHIKVIIFFAPVDDEHTMFYIRFYTNMFKTKILNNLSAQSGKFMNRIIERQDKRIVETQKPKASSLFCGENLLKGDTPVMMYRRMRDQLQKNNQ